MNKQFLDAVPILRKIENAGFEAYFVGGAVRDLILGRQIDDIDIASSATPDEIKSIFPRTIDLGIEHGTVMVLFDNSTYEVTTFRTEAGYADFRRPQSVKFIRSLTEDLKRRDFTMNSIAMDSKGNLIDPFSGEAAIREKVIKTVGRAEDRFSEDALRMLRAVRFLSQLTFTIEESTFLALSKSAPLLAKIAVERKRAEFEKLLVGSNRINAIKTLIDTEMLDYLPKMNDRKDQFAKVALYSSQDLALNEMWALILHCLEIKEEECERFLRAWSIPVKQIKEIQKIIVYLRKRLVNSWKRYDLYSAQKNTILAVENIYHVLSHRKDPNMASEWEAEFEKLPIKERSQLCVTGNDLMQWFEKQGGPWIKDCLTKIEIAILESQINNHPNEIKEWLSRCNQKSEKNY